MYEEVLEVVLDVLMSNEDNEIREINVQEILDSLRSKNMITQEKYKRLWRRYLPETEPK